MRLFLFFASLSTAVSSGYGAPPNVSRNTGHLFIANPNYTDISNYPYTVAVLKGNELLGGGVIMNHRWVLTAAYNTDGFDASELTVRVGSDSPTSGGRLYGVTKFVQHPQYTANWTYDLSLLKLVQPVVKPGKPIKAFANKEFSGTASVVVTGYGATSGVKEGDSSGLQVASIQMYDYVTCNKLWYGDELSAGEICGYAPGVGPCWADFGDPVAECDGQTCTLVGIFAGAYGCADDHFPGIYMDIGAFYEWINSIISGRKDIVGPVNQLPHNGQK